MTVYVRRPRPHLDVYTDGALSKGHGGWAWAALDIWRSASGYAGDTTSQRMELQAALDAVQILGPRHRVCIYSDSAYLINCFADRWYEGWIFRGWVTRDGKQVANRDIWEPLIKGVLKYRVTFVKVKGHSGIYGNEYVDKMAVQARLEGAKRSEQD